MSWLNTLVTDHPGAAVLLVLILLGVLAWAWATLRWFLMRELKRMEEIEKRQDKELRALDARLTKYDKQMAVSQQSFDDFTDRVDTHIEKEGELPEKVASIETSLAAVVTDIKWISDTMKKNGGKT